MLAPLVAHDNQSILRGVRERRENDTFDADTPFIALGKRKAAVTLTVTPDVAAFVHSVQRLRNLARDGEIERVGTVDWIDLRVGSVAQMQ